MKTYKIGAKLGSNELTTKLQQLSKEAQRKAEQDRLSDSEDGIDDILNQPQTNFIEIEASINLELKKWRRKVALKVLEQESSDCDDCNSSESSFEDHKSSSVPRPAKAEEFFSDKNSFLFFEFTYKPLRQKTLQMFSSIERSQKVQRNKHIDKVLDTLLDDWHKFAQNRINDEGAKNPDQLQEYNVMSQQPTSQHSGNAIQNIHMARYNKIFSVIQSAHYNGAKVFTQPEQNKYLKRAEQESEFGVLERNQQGKYLPFHPQYTRPIQLQVPQFEYRNPPPAVYPVYGQAPYYPHSQGSGSMLYGYQHQQYPAWSSSPPYHYNSGINGAFGNTPSVANAVHFQQSLNPNFGHYGQTQNMFAYDPGTSHHQKHLNVPGSKIPVPSQKNPQPLGNINFKEETNLNRVHNIELLKPQQPQHLGRQLFQDTTVHSSRKFPDPGLKSQDSRMRNYNS